MADPWQELANAIVAQAVTDCRSAMRQAARTSTPTQGETEGQEKKREAKHRRAVKTVRECEDFFRSKWYRTLTDIDGELLIEKLRKDEYEGLM